MVLIQSVQAFLQRINEAPLIVIYIFFFVSAILQITFPPYPGDSVLIFGGYFASIWLKGGSVQIFLPYWLGTVLCSLALYELGEWKGEKLLGIKFVNRWFPGPSQNKAREWLKKYETAAILLCKFVPGLNSLIIFFCGMFRLNRTKAYITMIAASAVHNMSFFIAGRTIGRNWDHIGGFLSMYNKVVLVLAIGAIIIFAVCRIWTRRKKVPDA